MLRRRLKVEIQQMEKKEIKEEVITELERNNDNNEKESEMENLDESCNETSDSDYISNESDDENKDSFLMLERMNIDLIRKYRKLNENYERNEKCLEYMINLNDDLDSKLKIIQEENEKLTKENNNLKYGKGCLDKNAAETEETLKIENEDLIKKNSELLENIENLKLKLMENNCTLKFL